MTILGLVFILICIAAALSRSRKVCEKIEQWKNRAASWLPYLPADPVTSSSPSEKTQKEEKRLQYVFPPLQPKTSSRSSMGLKRLEKSNWLTIDAHYTSEHQVRNYLLRTSHPNVIQCLPGSEAACHEVLSTAVDFLITRFPDHFTIEGETITNHIANESFLVGPDCPNPLEVAARLSMEDFNILMKNAETGEYHLQASATLFPAGWKLQERIGSTMANLHGPVPGWKEKMGGAVNRYFDHLSAKTAMERTNLFIQSDPSLFSDAPEIPTGHEKRKMPQDLQVRRERQTFTRLEKTGAVLFTVRTYMQPLEDLEDEEAVALIHQVRGWDEEMRVYKGWDVWGGAFEEWCEKRFGR
ncbi:hypothetical protein LAWI1_G002248 [Lachnellula willkommii]|uniref:Alpha-1,2-mannosyltransferase n=1 Tax=Lachnellula willkommii TaxID=215461 RepID=A0A559M988_9HELO|nr:hypothetical protein LAWI1_G002248 [Lachnellula willkommii]